MFAVRRLAPDGQEAWKQVVERGYEGLVAKDKASAYESGPTSGLKGEGARGDRGRRPLAAGEDGSVIRSRAVSSSAKRLTNNQEAVDV